MPTLVLSGELDLTTPPDLAREVADQIPDAAFELVSGEAHMYFQEEPSAFNAPRRPVLGRSRRAGLTRLYQLPLVTRYFFAAS